jgi:hypothetical protein
MCKKPSELIWANFQKQSRRKVRPPDRAHPGGGRRDAMTYATRLQTSTQLRPLLLQTWAAAGLSTAGAAKFDWFYEGHPEHVPQVLSVHPAPDAPAVGVSSLAPRAMVWQDEAIAASIQCDFCVLPGHRGGVASGPLLRAVLDEGVRHSAIVYGFPNRLAAAAQQRAGFTLLGEYGSYAKVLRPLALLLKRWRGARGNRAGHPGPDGSAAALAVGGWCVQLGRYAARLLPATDPRLDELWARRPAHLLLGRRDSRFLGWRMAQPGKHPPVLVGLFDAAQVLQGYFVATTGHGALHIVDFFVSRLDDDSLPALLRAAARFGRDAGACVLRLGFFGTPQVTRALAGAGWWRRDTRPVIAAGPLLQRLRARDCYFTAYDEDDV